MKKLYLVNTNARREFWTVEMLENKVLTFS